MKPCSRPQSCGLLRRKPDREVTRLKLEFQQLRKRYGQKEALRGVSITLSEGVYGLLGPNGAGKSTLMNILAGNLQADSGRILFCGEDIRRTGSDFPARLGYMPQQQTLYPGFTVERFLYYMASLRGMKRGDAAARIDWALGAVGLSDVRGKTIRSLSGGMKQRLLLAQAILDEPDILILDEPTAGLDPRQRIAVRNLIAEIALQKIVIVSTHVVPDVEYVASELLLLSEGRLLRKASPAELTHELAGQVWEAELAESELPAAQAAGTVCGIARVDAGHIRVRLLAEKQPPFACRPLAPELEDVYLHYFGAEDGL